MEKNYQNTPSKLTVKLDPRQMGLTVPNGLNCTIHSCLVVDEFVRMSNAVPLNVEGPTSIPKLRLLKI